MDEGSSDSTEKTEGGGVVNGEDRMGCGGEWIQNRRRRQKVLW